jgi:hypothetical protein
MAEKNNDVTKRIFMVIGFIVTLLMAIGAAITFVQSGDNKVREEVRTTSASKDSVEALAKGIETFRGEVREDIQKIRTEQRTDFRELSEKIDRLAKPK